MAIALWAMLGLGVGATLTPVAQRLASAPNRRRPLLSAVVLAPMTGVLFGLLAWRVHPAAVLAGDSAVAAVAVPLAATDLVEQRLPRVLVALAYPAVIAALVVATVQEHDDRALIRSLLGMVALFLFFLTVALVTGDVGAGDVRLVGVLGLVLAWRSWASLLAGTVLGLAGAGVVAAVLITTGHCNLRTRIPLGPALIAGTFAALLVPLG
jgi:leader peptidase (prepilin peptidase)/N-methyltransferase